MGPPPPQGSTSGESLREYWGFGKIFCLRLTPRPLSFGKEKDFICCSQRLLFTCPPHPPAPLPALMLGRGELC